MIRWQYLLFIVFIACKKDGPQDTVKPVIPVQSGKGVYIINEGNFQFGNSKISYYDMSNDAVIEDIYKQSNNAALGDVCQSMTIAGSKAYIVVNNSQKVVIVNAASFVKQQEITGFTSPRYFLPVSNSKAYVTDLFANAISIVNLSSNTITGNIPLNGWTEELILSYGKVYITNKNSNKVYVINTLNDAIIDSIAVGYASNSIREDKNGKLWVLCEGNQSSLKASLHCINPVTDNVEKSFEFSNATDSPWRLKINGSNDTLYYLNKGVYRLAISDASLPSNPFISATNHTFYGIGINPNNGDVYVADAIDYVQKGRIYRYKADGTLIGNFLAGIAPSDFYFN